MKETVIGHGKIVEHLRRRAGRGTLAHAYIFAGPEGIGKRHIALGLTKSLLCMHPKTLGRSRAMFDFCGSCPSCSAVSRGISPNVVDISPRSGSDLRGGGEIVIRDIRDLRRRLALKPSYGTWKVVLIEPAECMTDEAAHAFLKTLEEPRGQTVFILITAHPHILLPTVRSRAETINFRPVSRREIVRWLHAQGFSGAHIETIARLSFGRPGEAMTLLNDPTQQERYRVYAEALQELLRSDYARRLLFVEEKKENETELFLSLRTWTIFLRDVLLRRLGLERLTVFLEESSLLETLLVRYPLQELARTIRIAEQSLGYFHTTNVQPRSIVEHFLLQI